MIELAIFIGIIVVVWKLRNPIQAWSEVQAQKAEVWATDSQIDMQEDLAELDAKVEAVKAANDGKWFSLHEIQSKMK